MCTTGRNNPTAAKANHKIQPYAVLVFRYIKIQNHAKMCLKSFSYGSDIFWDMKQYAQILAESKAMKIQSLCSSPRVGGKKNRCLCVYLRHKDTERQTNRTK